MVASRNEPRRLTADELSGRCDPVQLAGIAINKGAPVGFIGQENAVASLRFGLTQNTDGYNIVVVNPNGTNRLSVLRQTTQAILAECPLPYNLHDYCYVYNFATPECPRLVVLPAGKGKDFKQAVSDLFRTLLKKIPEALLSDTIVAEIQRMQYERELSISQAVWSFSTMIYRYGLTVFQYPDTSSEGPATSVFEMVSIEPVINPDTLQPITNEQGEPMMIRGKLEDWARNMNVTEEERARRHKLAMQLGQQFQEIRTLTMLLADQCRREIEEYRIKTAADVLNKAMGALSPLADYPEASEYLAALRQYALDNLAEFINKGRPSDEDITSQEIPVPFYVKIYVQNDPAQAHQLIVEPDDFTPAKFMGTFNPERAANGMTIVNHTRMLAGILARANGGVLLINGSALFRSPRGVPIWQYLVKALRQKTIVPEEDMGGLNALLDIPSSTNFRPEPIPLQVKVVLLIDRLVYSAVLMGQIPDQMNELFRVHAELDNTAPRSPDNYAMYINFIEECRLAESLLPFDVTAIARIIEYSARLSGDVEDLSLDLREIKAICIEANRVARDAGASIITSEHVLQGIQKKRGRTSLVRNKMLQAINRGIIIVHTEGKVVGRGNGLAVQATVNDQFGIPMTVTCRKFYGPSFAVSFLDSQVKGTGRTFDKAALTIETLLRVRYGANRDFPIRLSISFEQTYGGIDGDSASIEELLVACSAIGDIPIRQDFAITGSISQHGEVQPIGGVNQKIEGFFDVCITRGLNGQSVLIPEINVRHLTLRNDIVEACKKGVFNVMAYNTFEQAAEFAYGMPMEEVDKANNAAIDEAIARAKQAKKDAQDDEDKEKKATTKVA